MVINLKSPEDRLYVLLIEHDPELRKIMELSLQQAGLEVGSVGRYANALQVLGQRAPDIFIIDFDLRDGDPGGLISAYRRHPKFTGGPVVISTSDRLNDDWRRKHKPDTVIYKPFDMRYLIRLIGVFEQEKVR
jgi:two-component system OmpR family response regulator